MSHLFKKIIVEFIKNTGGSIYKSYRNTIYSKGKKENITLKDFVKDKTKNIKYDMNEEEALKILNFDNKIKPNEKEILDRYNDYFDRNDPEKGGSLYIRSKIKNAKDILIDNNKNEGKN